LTPEFSGRYGKGDHRWVNVLRISSYSDRSIATVLPFNAFDRRWPRLGIGGDLIPVGSEGWVFPQKYKNLGQSVSLLSADDAIARVDMVRRLTAFAHFARRSAAHLVGGSP